MATEPLGLPSADLSRRATVVRWVRGTFAGGAIAFGALLKLLALLIRALGWSTAEAIDTAGDLALIAGASAIAWRLFVDARRRLLWRVRRKLTISYVFIGVVPVLLVVVFFAISGLLLFMNVGSYVLRTQVTDLVDQTQFLAQSAALDLQHAAAMPEMRATLDRRLAAAVPTYPGVSYAIVPARSDCRGAAGQDRAATQVTAGNWAHLTAPASLPAWIPCRGFAGLVPYADGGNTWVAARTVLPLGAPWSDSAVVVDVPFGPELLRRFSDDTGITLESMSSTSVEDREAAAAAAGQRRVFIGNASLPVGDTASQVELLWVAFLDRVDWTTGETAAMLAAFRVSPVTLYGLIFDTTEQIGQFTFEQVLLVTLAVVAALFLIIQGAAFLMGLSLARSITGSVHELFAGTERVRRGDFSGRIAIRSRDQLGELAESFNSMTSSIEDLLQQKAEKERLEQELRIARSIQMSLLPQGELSMRGLCLTAHCEPAREVGGDYYDFLPIDDQTLGIMVADVSGKGTSAALYMAELKGIVLSLSRQHTSPRHLLIDANSIISRHLDSRSFITASYLLIDLQAATLRYSRAGHCPMIFLPGPHAHIRTPEVLTPDGMVLGLQLDDGQMFIRALEEVTLPLAPGDLFLLYTDGITEAMNAEGDCFGDDRLAAVVQACADGTPDEMRDHILREVRAFSGGAAQQDDMTLVLVRVEEVGASRTRAPAAELATAARGAAGDTGHQPRGSAAFNGAEPRG